MATQASTSVPLSETKVQSLAPLIGAPVRLGTAPTGAIVKKAVLDNRSQARPTKTEPVRYADNIRVMHSPSVNAAKNALLE